MADFFIRRPIFAIVISLMIVILGIISAVQLPIAQYPEISPPYRIGQYHLYRGQCQCHQ